MDEPVRTPFGARMFEARERLGLSQEAVCRKIGIAQSTLSELESGGTGSRYTAAFARLYGVDTHYLADGVGEQRDPLDDVVRLVTLYRNCNPAGRTQILTTAVQVTESRQPLETVHTSRIEPKEQPLVGKRTRSVKRRKA